MPTVFQSPAKAKKPSASSSVKPASVPEGQRMSPLASFAVSPKEVRFETQEEQEVVELFLRQHPIVNVPWIAIAIVMIIAPTILFPLISHLLPIAIAIPVRYIVVGTVFWYVATFGFVLASFLYWFFNIYIVTNERVVDIDFLYLLYKRFSEAELAKIQDLSFTTGGVPAAIFDYGDVLIETAGELPNIKFEKIPHPEKVVETIRTLSGLEEKEKEI